MSGNRPESRLSVAKGVRKADFFVNCGDDGVPDAISMLSTFFRPLAGRKEEFSW